MKKYNPLNNAGKLTALLCLLTILLTPCVIVNAGERGVLMGALAGIISAQYEVLRENGHSPSEAFNETVEELTQSLVPLISENGMDWCPPNK
jgi:hypothetical protein